MSAATLCEEITRRREQALGRRIEAYPRSNPIASDLGECAREMVLAMTHWKDRPLPSPELKARFERGNLIEDRALMELAGLGLHVRVERKAFEIKDRKGRRLSQDDINHYQKIVVAISETIRLMAEIDKVIDAHGGWPGAFVTANAKAKP